MPVFKLLLLPNVALQELLRCFTPIELFELSQCSLKAAKSIQLVGGKFFELRLYYPDHVEINGYMFKTRNCHLANNYRAAIGTREFGDQVVKIDYKNYKSELISFWDDPLVGLSIVFFHLSKLFNCPTNTLHSNGSLSREQFNYVMKFVVARQKTIQSLWFSARGLTTKDINFTMENLKVLGDFFIFSQFPYDFESSNAGFDSPKSITIYNSSWVTLENVLSMKNAIEICLFDSSLTNQDINQFFREWRSGNFEKLKYLSIKSSKFDENLNIEGFDKLEDTANPRCLDKVIYDEMRTIVNGVQIQKMDGAAAMVRYVVQESEIILMML